MIYIGMDDTDNPQSRGTGALARSVAADLAGRYTVLGVIRQQLLRDPRVPCTKNNSSKAIILAGEDGSDLVALAAHVRSLMLADYQPDSDPGLCVAGAAPDEVVRFGLRVQHELVTKAEARDLAARHGIYLEELGGDGMGIIGALAAVGLTAGGETGRYIQIGQVRSLVGAQPVEALLTAGINAIMTPEGREITEGEVQADGLRPARRGLAVAVVQQADGLWVPLKLD